MALTVAGVVAYHSGYEAIHDAESVIPTQNYLWYKQPAVLRHASLPWGGADSLKANVRGSRKEVNQVRDAWESQTLPIGNGRVGGTVFGGDHLDCVHLNEVSLWSGGPNLPENGFYYEYGPTADKDDFGNYQPFAKLFADFELTGKTENYTRSLDLRDGIARVQFDNAGVRHSREYFVSHPDNVLVYTARANKPGNVNAKLALTPHHSVSYSFEGQDTIIMSGTLANGQKFEGRMLVRADGGTVKPVGQASSIDVRYTGENTAMRPEMNPEKMPYIQVSGANHLEVYISLATDYKMDYDSEWKGEQPSVLNKSVLAAVSKKSLVHIRSAHTDHYKRLFNRMSIRLGKSDTAYSGLPTDERIAAFAGADKDPELIGTIYQYGRYVLICGSRPGNLPVNLQGIWNDKVYAPWACDYHNNINLQMCYWGAEVANLSECHEPLLDFIRSMEKPLTLMTQKEFGAETKGWTTRISQNPWGGGGWEHWNPPVNAWYALHLWDHYAFTHDREYLKQHAYPILKNICHFWEGQLKEIGAKGEGLLTRPIVAHPDRPAIAEYAKVPLPLMADKHPELAELKAGMLVSPMGWSHEWGPIEDGCMHDQQLIDELFQITEKAAAILGVDKEWAAQLAEKRSRLAPNRVGKGGYLQEWIVDRPDMVVGQRHTSHLIGVYPGSVISPEKTPELAKAAMKSLELRGLTADNRRSWTWPWRTALWARFLQPEKALDMVNHYVLYNVLDNLFGNHPPMQMDGTFGMTGGMSEMFIQSHAGMIHLLPALPAQAWPEGEIRGIRARGNITVDIAWKKGRVTQFRLTTTEKNPGKVAVKVNGEVKHITPTVRK